MHTAPAASHEGGAENRRLMKQRSRAGVRYEFDEKNRLIVSEPAPPSGRLRLVRVLSGSMTTDRGNRLVYEASAPAAHAVTAPPHQIVLDGRWRLGPDHALLLVLSEGETGRRGVLRLRGELARADAHAVVFSVRQEGPEGTSESRQIALTGRWQADPRNRLAFLVQKADGSEDRLTLQGAWEIGKRHELVYQYRRLADRSTKALRTVRFSGWWDVLGPHRLAYRLEADGRSGFEFRVGIESPSLHAKEGRLAYQAGIRLAGSRTVVTRIALFGKWKLGRDLAVEFEIPYADGRRRAIRFAGTVAMAQRNRLSIDLASRWHEPLGMTVLFTRALTDDAAVMLRMRKEGRDVEALAGVRVRF